MSSAAVVVDALRVNNRYFFLIKHFYRPLHIAVVHQNNELVKRFVDIMTMSGKSVDRYNKLMQVR